MHSNTMNQLLVALKAAITYEKEHKNLKQYFNVVNSVLYPNAPIKECSSCGALMEKYHGDFQRQIWTRIMNEDASYIPELPTFETVRYNTEYQVKTLKLCSFKDLRMNETNCDNEAKKMRRIGNGVEAQKHLNDKEALKTYRLAKYNYFEKFLPELEAALEEEQRLALVAAQEEENKPVKERRDRLINKEELIVMKEAGKTHQECGDHFGVNKSAISLMLKELGWKRK